jgi:hypothetical protein
MTRVSRVLTVMAFLGALASMSVANAQIVGGHISGIITDELGKPVCDVYVTAHGVEQSQLIKTDTTGEFRLHDLVPGRYVLTVARDGFTTIVHSGIMVRGGKTARLPLVMKVAPNWAAPITEAADPFALLPPSSHVSADLIARYTPNPSAPRKRAR